MRAIWTEQRKFEAYLRVEILAAEAWSELGVIPKEDVAKLWEKASFSIDRIKEIEEQTHHDIVAFTRAVSETLGEERKWVHYGLTSTDVVDTANGYLIKQANEILLKDIEDFIEMLRRQALRFKDTPCIGRTHGIHADITCFGLKWVLWHEEMMRNLERFRAAARNIEVGKLSGAVGNFANIPPFIQDYVCEKLGIQSANISTQVIQRDRHAYYMATLAVIAASLEQMAFEVRNLQRTEVHEVEEAFGKGQKGSSAMPHKRNPISSENITGCARVMRGYMLTFYENVALWHERDISHSATERIILPDATMLLDYMLTFPWRARKPDGLSGGDAGEHLPHARRHLRPARHERPYREGAFARGSLRHGAAHRHAGHGRAARLSGVTAREPGGDEVSDRRGAGCMFHTGLLYEECRLHLPQGGD